MNIVDSIRSCFSKYVTFSGRAQRSEFWWWVVFVMVTNWILVMIDSALFGEVTTYSGDGQVGFNASSSTPVLSGIFGLLTLLPSISVAVRRLHDTDRSGWWYWLVLVPIVGWIILIIWYAKIGTSGENTYGADPLGGTSGGPPENGMRRSSIPSVQRD